MSSTPADRHPQLDPEGGHRGAGQHPPTDNLQEVANAAIDIKLTEYNGTTIPCSGTWSFPCKYQQSTWENTKFHIVAVKGPAVTGLPSSESLKIVTLHCSKTTDHDQGTASKLVSITSVRVQLS